MSTFASTTPSLPTIAGRYPVLLDRVATGHVINVALVAAGAVLMGILAQLTINIGVVPITGQTFGVLLLGAAMGARRAVASMVAYAVGGLAGIPWFAGFTGGPLMIMKPTFGYIIGFIVAAGLVGWCAERGWDRKVRTALPMYAGASLLIYACGLPYLWLMLHLTGTDMNLSALLWVGMWPFIPGDTIKCVLAAAVSPATWSLVNRFAQ